MHTISIPLFLSKLWKIVSEQETDGFICWSDDGSSFIIHNPNDFASIVLPQYFKHNQYASFVRQLNMYGFRKIATSDIKNEMENQEFYNPYFQRERSDLLSMIKRKASTAKGSTANMDSDSNQVKDILLDVQAIQGKQENMDNRLEELRSENKALWTEVADLRRRHQDQEKIVKTLLKFLLGLYNGSLQKSPNKRKIPFISEGNRKILKLSSGQSSSMRTEDNQGPVIHELTDFSSSNVGDMTDTHEPGIVMSPMSTLNTPQPDMSPKLDNIFEDDEEIVPFVLPIDRSNSQVSSPIYSDLDKLLTGVNKSEKLPSSQNTSKQVCLTNTQINNLATHIATVRDQLGIVKQQIPERFPITPDIEELFGVMVGDKTDVNMFPPDLSAISNCYENKPFEDFTPTQDNYPNGKEIIQYTFTGMPVDIPSEMDLEVPVPSLAVFENYLPTVEDPPLD